MAVNGKFDGIDLADLYAVGERNEVPGYKRCVREVLAAVDAWPDFAAQAEVPPDVTANIAADRESFRPR